MFDWLKKNKGMLILFCVFIALGIPLIINILFKIHLKISFLEAEWSAGEALDFYGSFLSFLGTVVLGALALYQNKIIKDESDKQSKAAEERKHEKDMPKFYFKLQTYTGNYLNSIFEIINIALVNRNWTQKFK